MAVLSEIVNTAKNGSVTSEEALADPYHPKVQLLNGDFSTTSVHAECVTDMHYDSRIAGAAHCIHGACDDRYR